MRPAVVSGVCTRDAPVTSCLIFSLSLVIVLGTLTQHRILLVSKVVITVNDVINAHFQIIASYLINSIRRPSLINAPCLMDAPFENYVKILSIH